MFTHFISLLNFKIVIKKKPVESAVNLVFSYYFSLFFCTKITIVTSAPALFTRSNPLGQFKYKIKYLQNR